MARRYDSQIIGKPGKGQSPICRGKLCQKIGFKISIESHAGARLYKSGKPVNNKPHKSYKMPQNRESDFYDLGWPETESALYGPLLGLCVEMPFLEYVLPFSGRGGLHKI